MKSINQTYHPTDDELEEIIKRFEASKQLPRLPLRDEIEVLVAVDAEFNERKRSQYA